LTKAARVVVASGMRCALVLVGETIVECSRCRSHKRCLREGTALDRRVGMAGQGVARYEMARVKTAGRTCEEVAASVLKRTFCRSYGVMSAQTVALYAIGCANSGSPGGILLRYYRTGILGGWQTRGRLRTQPRKYEMSLRARARYSCVVTNVTTPRRA